jgi:hypothetical protein
MIYYDGSCFASISIVILVNLIKAAWWQARKIKHCSSRHCCLTRREGNDEKADEKR